MAVYGTFKASRNECKAVQAEEAMRPDHCTECGKVLDADNPIVSGGGNLSYEGVWTEWALGACCREPITSEAMQKLMTEENKLPR